MKYSPKEMNNILNENDFNFKKKFGQNFIVDENIINSIITKSNIDKDTLVIEIGPGAGSLTNKLAENAGYVLAYEIDTTLKNILDNTMSKYENYEIVYEDFLKTNVKEKLNNLNYQKVYVVANLPYYITTPIITKIIEDELGVDKIVVMVQKEVGNRFKASPGSKDYGSLTIYLNYYFSIRKLIDVSKNVFIPKPNVDSIVVEFTKKNVNKTVNDKELFFKLVRDSFKQKRKTLKNNLDNYDLEKVNEILNKYNHDLSVRAENISIDEFIDISNNL